MVWVLLGALGAYVASDLGLSPLQKGLMVAVPPLGGSAFRLIVGPLADRAGTKRTGLVTLAPHDDPAAVGLAGRRHLRAGASASGCCSASPAPASRWPCPWPAAGTRPSTRASRSASPAPATPGRSSRRWRRPARRARRLARRVRPRHHPGRARVGGVLRARQGAAATGGPFGQPVPPPARSRRSLALRAVYMVTFGGYVGLCGYLPIFLVDRFDLTKVSGAGYAALCALAGSLLRPVGGALADRIGGARVPGRRLRHRHGARRRAGGAARRWR